MAATVEPRARESVGRSGAAFRVAGTLRNHRTLWVGILYVIAISVVLAFVARL
jgi:hypothetical protein